MKLNVAFYCNSIPFTPETCRLEHSLGGSETMLIGLARALAKIGHRVTIFTKFANLDDEGEYEGVTFRSHETFNDMMQPVEWDVFISCRTPSIMAAPVKAKARFLWLQDELILPKVLMGHLWQTDRLIFVSEWHKQHYCERLPELEKLSWVTRNGVDLKLIQESIQGVERDRNSLIYISRPERGLDPLLQIFPKILERAPDTRLKICRYNSMYDPLPNVAAVCARADRMVAQTEGAQYLGHLGKAELYREIASSRLMVYPGVPNFNETSCIAAIEAQACGTPLICSNKGGLRETLDDEAGVKIDGDAFSCVYQERFADEVISLLTDDARVGGMQIAGSGHVQRYDYDLIASEWDAMFDKFFESRFEARSEGVYLQLLRHDDIVGALACAELADQDHAASICARLIAESVDERDLHKSDYAKHALEPAFETSQRSPRFEAVLQVTSQEVDTDLPFRVLDFACGNGSFAVMLANHFPNAIVTGVDFSPALIESAKTFAAKLPCSDRVEFVCAELDDLDGLHTYDVVFVGEYLEHTEAYQNVIDTLESHLEQGGVFIATMPYGPFGELIRYGQPRSSIQGHVIHWEYSDILEVFGGLLDFDCLAVRFGSTPKGDPHGHWVVHFRTSDAKTGKIDLARKATTTRPYESLAICMIGFDGDAKWVNLCMERIRDVADEIYVALHGDQVAMEATLKPWGVNLIKCPDLAPHIEPGRVQPPGDFGWFRNESISQAEADWIMWLDFDEIVTHPERLRRYLTDSPYNGHGLKQKHLTVDQQTSHDVPIRIFRNGRGYRFFGCTHEHAEDGMDNPIYPTFEIPDCDLAHYGYLTEQQRREKCIGRNFQWLMLDREVYPGRQLTDVLFARDCINFAHWERDGNGGRNTPKAVAYLNECLGYYRKGPWFNNPKHIYFKLIFGFYQKAMEWAEVGLPFRIGGKELRFGNPDELEDYSIAMIKQTCEELRFDYPQYREKNGGL